MKLFITTVVPGHPTKVSLQWELEEIQESGVFTFYVERSGSPGGPWTSLTPSGLADAYLYDDLLNDAEAANTLSLARDIYYRVKVEPPSGPSNAVYSPAVNLDGLSAHEMLDEEPGNPARPIPAGQYELKPLKGLAARPTAAGRKRLIKRALMRNLYLTLKHLNGVEYALLKRRHFGTRCTVCYDPNTRSVLKSNCSVCYGTSWVGGFYTPIYLLGRRLASQIQTSVGTQTKDDVRQVRIQMLDFPKIEEGDVLVERVHNHRFLVKQRYAPTVGTLATHQTLAVSELARAAPEYDVAVDLTP